MNELFPEDFVRKLRDWNTAGRNSHVVAICKRAELEPYRAQLEKWYSHLPEDVKRSFAKRLRHKALYGSHVPHAAFELFFHEYCLRKGWRSEHEPKLGDKTPDYLVRDASGRELFYLEVTCFEEADKTVRWGRRIEEFETKLERQLRNSPFRLTLSYREIPAVDFDMARAVQTVETWLQGLPSTPRARQEMRLSEGVLKATVHADWVGLRLGGRVLWGHIGPMVCCREAERLRPLIMEKASKYRGIAPLIVAVGVTAGLVVDDDCFLDALYGTEQVVFGITGLETGTPALDGPARTERAPDGVFVIADRKRTEVRWPNLSGVIRCWQSGAETRAAEFRLTVYHALYPRTRLDPGLFGDVCQHLVERDGDRLAVVPQGEDSPAVCLE